MFLFSSIDILSFLNYTVNPRMKSFPKTIGTEGKNVDQRFSQKPDQEIID